MSAERVDWTTHNIQVAAPAGVVYALIADAVKWPLYCSANVHVERMESDGERERLRKWLLIDGQLKTWIAWRHLDPVERRIEFCQEPPACPPDSLGGELSVRRAGLNDSELVLLYHSTVEDLPDETEWIERATEEVSRAQLANLKSFAERWTSLDDLVLSFEDSVRVNGPAELVYDFLYRAGDWPELVPHVIRVDLTEDAPGVQRMSMDALAEHGSCSTESVRICFPHAGRIIYKQTVTPALLAAHIGEWSVIPDETGVTVVAQHSVVLSEENIPAALGEQAGLAQARRHVRQMLGRSSLALLGRAKQHAETAVRML